MKTNFSMLFYMKKQKNYACGDAPIYLRYIAKCRTLANNQYRIIMQTLLKHNSG